VSVVESSLPKFILDTTDYFQARGVTKVLRQSYPRPLFVSYTPIIIDIKPRSTSSVPLYKLSHMGLFFDEEVLY